MFYFALNITNRIKAEKKNQLYSEKKMFYFFAKPLGPSWYNLSSTTIYNQTLKLDVVV